METVAFMRGDHTPLDQHTIEEMVRSASEILVQSGDGDNHTVAATIYAADGLTYSGVNLYHFTGGPCAEIVALARLISDGGAKPLAIVAVADRERGVVAPCGRCRQVLADYCRNIQVIMDINGELGAKPLEELLPYTYFYADQQ